MSRRHSIVYTIAEAIALPLYMILVKTSIEGEHFLPQEGAVVLASNHISFVDPLAMGYLGHRRKRQIHFLAKDGLFKNPILRRFFLACGQIPVSRGTAQASDSLIPAQEALRKERVVGIYPEGTMTDDLSQLPIKSGAVRLSIETGAPIVVIGSWGTHEIWRKGHKPHLRFRVKHAMVVLPPYVVDPEMSIEDARQELASKMLDATAKAISKRGDA